MGTPTKIEHSIQNAYLKGMLTLNAAAHVLTSGVAIQMSEHFVYIENQFFITSYELYSSQDESKTEQSLEL